MNWSRRYSERVGAGAGVRAFKADGVQVYEDDGIKNAPAMLVAGAFVYGGASLDKSEPKA